MSDTLVGWLLGGWSFGRSSDNARAGGEAAGDHAKPLHERKTDSRESDARAVDVVETDDGRLITQIREGDAAALKTLFLRYYSPLVAFATTYVGSTDDGEEVVASVLAWVWEHRATWTPTPSVSAYLFAAVRNRALNTVKRRALHNQQMAVWSALGETPGTARTSLGPAEQVERDDDTAALLALIAKLPERRRLILSLRWTHELAWDEIAAVLGVPSGTVRSEYSRILAGLRAGLEG